MGSIERNYVFNILRKQIENRCNWNDPNANPLEMAANFFWDSCIKDGVMHLGSIRLPDIRWFGGWYMWPVIYADSILIHHLFNNDYSENNVQLIEDMNSEGPYGYENVIVEPGDVVIDAGAYIGDFSAVASAMGGDVHAFDPCPTYRSILNDVARMNSFKTYPFALGEKSEFRDMNIYKGAGAEQIVDQGGNFQCEVGTIDRFRSVLGKPINFIKADIEGFERYMLKGAAKVLEEDQPKLAIKTYHSPEDRYVLPKIIHDINPNYKIINRIKCLYAYV